MDVQLRAGLCRCIDLPMKFPIASVFAGAVAMSLASCAPTTPVGRIEANPHMFDSLPMKQRDDVREGRISRGMSHDAVFLAWGRPSRVVEIMRPDGPAVRWDYTGTRPVHANQGSRWNDCWPYRRCRSTWPGYGLGPDVVYVPYHRASVWFINDKVDSWENER